MISTIDHLVASYGYIGLALVIGLESAGIPLPGETALITAALYAATRHELDIVGVIAAAVTGAVIGDNLGYWVGRRFGLPILERFGPKIGISAEKLKLGRYLFAHYGLGVVFFGRFVALLRALAALLAGVNQMAWPHFFAANLAGAVVWATLYGSGAYLLGHEIHKIAGPFGIATLTIAACLVLAGLVAIRRNEQLLQARADAEFPD